MSQKIEEISVSDSISKSEQAIPHQKIKLAKFTSNRNIISRNQKKLMSNPNLQLGKSIKLDYDIDTSEKSERHKNQFLSKSMDIIPNIKIQRSNTLQSLTSNESFSEASPYAENSQNVANFNTRKSMEIMSSSSSESSMQRKELANIQRGGISQSQILTRFKILSQRKKTIQSFLSPPNLLIELSKNHDLHLVNFLNLGWKFLSREICCEPCIKSELKATQTLNKSRQAFKKQYFALGIAATIILIMSAEKSIRSVIAMMLIILQIFVESKRKQKFEIDFQNFVKIENLQNTADKLNASNQIQQEMILVTLQILALNIASDSSSKFQFLFLQTFSHLHNENFDTQLLVRGLSLISPFALLLRGDPLSSFLDFLFHLGGLFLSDFALSVKSRKFCEQLSSKPSQDQKNVQNLKEYGMSRIDISEREKVQSDSSYSSISMMEIQLSRDIDNKIQGHHSALVMGQNLAKTSTNNSHPRKLEHDIMMSDSLFESMNKSQMIFRLDTKRIQSEKKLIRNVHDTQTALKNLITIRTGNLALEILKITSDFQTIIPTRNDIKHLSPGVWSERWINRSRMSQDHAKHLKFSHGSQNVIYRNKILSNDHILSRPLNEIDTIFKLQIYQPYFISNTTILAYEKLKSNKKLSIMDIVETYQKSRKSQTKLFFKVASDALVTQENEQQGSEKHIISDENENFLEQYYEKSESDQKKLVDKTMYFEIEMKQLNNKEKDNSPRKAATSANLFKENMKDIDESKQVYLLIIKDITNIIKSQQKLSDEMYQDAIEQNYSHEQMTPLNIILSSSKIISKRFIEMQTLLDELHQNPELRKESEVKNQETLKILKSIEQSGQSMWFYNQNQIQRMKIQKNEVRCKYSVSKDPVSFVQKVIFPFEKQIQSRNIKLYFSKTNDFNFQIKTDWVLYQLILFNIMQNAVKYNQFNGDILLVLRCLPKKQQKLKKYSSKESAEIEINHILETEVIDTGIGISKERQKLLFKPFMELKLKQNLKQVQDGSIGIGLACSKSIVNALNGDITIKKSKRGLTVFSFKFPVQSKPYEPKTQSNEEIQTFSVSKLQEQNDQKVISDTLLKYLKKIKVEKFQELKQIKETVQIDQQQLNMRVLKKQITYNKSSMHLPMNLSGSSSQRVDKIKKRTSANQFMFRRKRIEDIISQSSKNEKNYSNSKSNNFSSKSDQQSQMSFKINEAFTLKNKSKPSLVYNQSSKNISLSNKNNVAQSQNSYSSKSSKSMSAGKSSQSSHKFKIDLAPCFFKLHFNQPQKEDEEQINSSQICDQISEREEEYSALPHEERFRQREHKKKKRAHVARSQSTILEKYKYKNISKDISHKEKKEIAHNLIMQNQRDPILSQMRHNRADDLIIDDLSAGNYSEQPINMQLGSPAPSSSSSSEIRELMVNDFNYPKSWNLSNSVYSDDDDDSSISLSHSHKDEKSSSCSDPQEKLKQQLDNQKSNNNCHQLISLIEEVQEEYDEDVIEEIKERDKQILGNMLQTYKMGQIKSNQMIPPMKECNCNARILVVDDTDFNILAVKLMIKENFMIDIEEAVNGQVAVEMFKEGYNRPCGCSDRTYKLIFMDLQMPVMGGIEASKIISEMIQKDLLKQKEQKGNQSGPKIFSQRIKKKEKSNSIGSGGSNGLEEAKYPGMRQERDWMRIGEIQESSRVSESTTQAEEITNIVALTSYTNEKIKQECQNSGIKDFVNKPLTYKNLHRIMWRLYFKIEANEYKSIYKQAFNQSLSFQQSHECFQ